MPAARRKGVYPIPRSDSSSSVYTTSGVSQTSESEAGSPSPSLLTSKQRRTRKRISQSQLNALEDLFARSSHPSQDDREALALSIGMEVRSVTVWFQNRRQAVRKVSLHEAITLSNQLATTAEDGTLLTRADLLAAASSSDGGLLTMSPVQERKFSSIHLMKTGGDESHWLSKNSPGSSIEAESPPSINLKCDMDEDTFAAALALARMREVDD